MGDNVLKAVLRHDLFHIGGLPYADFKDQRASQTEGRPPSGRNRPVEIQAVLAPVQRAPGLIIPDRHVQIRQIPMGNIGWIAGNHVKVPKGRGRGGHGIGLNTGHPGVELVAPDVLLTDAQRPLRQVGQHHAAVRSIGSHCQAHTAASGAQIQYSGPVPRRPRQEDGPFRQHLRIGARNQHLPGNIQWKAVKLPLSDDVGHWLSGQAAACQLLHPVLHLLGGVKG